MLNKQEEKQTRRKEIKMIIAYKPYGYELNVFFSGIEKTRECGYKIKKIVRDAIKATLAHEDFEYDTEVSVTFCDNEYIHKLNKEYRNMDKPTDVLSFPLLEKEEIEELDGQAVALGDIVISFERAEEQAKEIGNSFEREVAFLTIHSTLHLLGYDHEDPQDEEEMFSRQRAIVEKLDIE